MKATERLAIRVSEEQKGRYEAAAELAGVSLSEWVVGTLEEAASSPGSLVAVRAHRAPGAISRLEGQDERTPEAVPVKRGRGRPRKAGLPGAAKTAGEVEGRLEVAVEGLRPGHGPYCACVGCRAERTGGPEA